jgi:hypothetical protein
VLGMSGGTRAEAGQERGCTIYDRMTPNIIKRIINAQIDRVKDWTDPNREENPMSCSEITIDGIDGALYGKLLAEAKAAGAKFDGATVSIDDCVFDWDFDIITSCLHFTCIHKPFIFSCGEVEGKIRSLVEKAKGGI